MMNRKEILRTASSQQVYDLLKMYTSGLDFRNPFDVARYDRVIREDFSKFTSFEKKIKDNEIVLTRARKHPCSGTLFNNIKELWYPRKEIANLSRANVPSEQVFYCSNDPGTTIFEVRPKKGDWITTLEINMPPLNLLAMGLDIREADVKEGELSEFDKGVNQFLREKFMKPVPDEMVHLYYNTAVFVRGFIKNKDGVLYPSVASPKLRGWNMALRTDFVDKYKYDQFRRATVHEVVAVRSPDDIEVRCLYQADYLDQCEDFIWRGIDGCAGHRIDENIYDR